MLISMNNKHTTSKLIHIAQFQPYRKKSRYLFLRQESPHRLTWYQETDVGEEPTEISASTIEEAIRLGRKHWKRKSFRTIGCGFRYTLPERDEHGMNALFHQMAASYSHPAGVYFDEELGHNCRVDNASQEALDLWRIKD